MKPKKILLVTPFFYPAWSYGGPPRVLFDLATHLTQDGLAIECLTTDVLDNSRYDKSEDVVNNISIKYFKNISNFAAYYLKVFWPIGLKKYLQKNIKSFDVVHIADFRNTCTYWAYKQCQKESIPYIITPYGTMPYTSGFKGWIKKIIDWHWGKDCLRNAKSVVVQTENEKQEALKLGVDPEKIQIIPLMIDSAKFATVLDENSFRKKFNIPNPVKIITFVGRINQHKATDTMIEAFADLMKKYPSTDFRLIIVGRDDGYEQALRQLADKLNITDKIIFTGPIYFPETIKVYQESDVFFMAPSHYEETSTASLEALVCGTPVVVTKQADIPFFSNYHAGFIVENEIELLTEALKKVLLDKNYKKEDCLQLIKDHFDILRVKEDYKEIYLK